MLERRNALLLEIVEVRCYPELDLKRFGDVQEPKGERNLYTYSL